MWQNFDSGLLLVPEGHAQGAGIAQWLQRQIHDQKVTGSSPSKNFLVQGKLSVLAPILVSIPPKCYCSSTYKILVILPEVQVAGYS